MDLKDIKELMNAMRRTGTTRVAIKNKDCEVELEREGNEVRRVMEPLIDSPEMREDLALHRANMALSRGGMMPVYHHSPAAPETTAPKQPDQQDVADVVTSPMVGTFYSSPSPDDPPFVKVGDKIEKGTVVCIVEAMKVMNEVKAGVSGTVTEVLIETGHPVEFGTKLFSITP